MSLLFECVGVYVSVSCACARVRICIVYNLGTHYHMCDSGDTTQPGLSMGSRSTSFQGSGGRDCLKVVGLTPTDGSGYESG